MRNKEVQSENPDDKLKSDFMSFVPKDASSISNSAIREMLGWSLEQYQRIRDQLIEESRLELWRGRGGTIRRTNIEVIPEKPEKRPKEVESVTRRQKQEIKLYPGFLESLKLWAKDQSWTDHIVYQLANQGRRPTGGIWTRPDFVAIGYKKFEYTPGIVRDVETFEIKTSACGIEAVFESAAHSRVATKSYLAIQRIDGMPQQEDLDRIESECVRFGLGLVLFGDPKNYNEWEYRAEPVRSEPDPFVMERFIQDEAPPNFLDTELR